MPRFTTRPGGLTLLCLVLSAATACSKAGSSPSSAPPAAVAQVAQKSGAPKLEAAEWVEITKVVDGDTIHVRRAGGIAKLRLLCVDTEERIHPGQAPSPSKPQTVFGEETGKWAEGFFAGLAKPGEKPRIGLYFPGGKEELDIFGRLLCHVILPDGSDYNLKLVREGRSPYFNKYGNSRVEHEAFVAAQAAARREKLGIWNPETNVAKTPGAPSATRPYAELLDWWDVRAQAFADFEKRSAAGERTLADAADFEAVARLRNLGPEREIELFCEIENRYNEPNGELTLELRGTDKDRRVRLVVEADLRAKLEPAKLDDLMREYRQNCFYARGKLRPGARGLELPLSDPAQIRRAGPEPSLPAPVR